MGIPPYNGNLSGFLTLCISLLAILAVSVPCAAETLSLQGPDQGIAGESAFVDLVLDRAPDGLSGYEISLHLVDGKAKKFTDVEFPDWAGLHETSPLPSSEIRIKAVDTGQGVDINDSGIVLARFSISCENNCPLTIEFDAVRIDTESGDASLVGPDHGASTEDGADAVGTIATVAPAGTGSFASGGGSGRQGSGASVTLHVTREVIQTEVPTPQFTQGTIKTTSQESPIPTPATTRTPLYGGVLTIMGISIAVAIIAGRR